MIFTTTRTLWNPKRFAAGIRISRIARINGELKFLQKIFREMFHFRERLIFNFVGPWV
jgi:hypothetical protein